MSDYDFSGAFTALFVIGIVIGAAAMFLVVWLASHLSITVRWV